MVDNVAHDASETNLWKVGEAMSETNSPVRRISIDETQSREGYPMRKINTLDKSCQEVATRVQDLPVSRRTGLIGSWFQNYAAVYSNIASFALIGCAVRIGLEKLLSPSVLNIEFGGSIIPVSFFSNMVGSFILGLLAGSTLKAMPGISPVYIGLSTGLCGSITTYSKFNQQISLMIIGEVKTNGDQYFTAFAAILLGLAAPICSFEFGQDISMEMKKRCKKENGTDFRTSFKNSFVEGFNFISLGFFIVSWVVLLVLSIVFSDNEDAIFICVSILMAPFGALLRFFFARYNKQPPIIILHQLPLGTFYANFIGSLILALSHVALAWSTLSCVWYNVLRAVQTGFCACLSTVSTLIAEISGMRGKGDIPSSHLYPFLTIFLCELVACIINGVSCALLMKDSAFPANATCS